MYCLRSTDSTHFVTILPGDSNEDSIRLRDAMTGQQFKPLPKIKLLRLALKGFLVRLSPRISPSVSAQPAAKAEPAPSAEPEAVGPVRKPDEILDMGAFSQLCEAAKASGLVPNADLIAHVRDREFRLCDYQKAFQLIEGLYGKFTAAATQRQQRLKREETDIASGKTKMSPKEVQQKRARAIRPTRSASVARGHDSRA